MALVLAALILSGAPGATPANGCRWASSATDPIAVAPTKGERQRLRIFQSPIVVQYPGNPADQKERVARIEVSGSLRFDATAEIDAVDFVTTRSETAAAGMLHLTPNLGVTVTGHTEAGLVTRIVLDLDNDWSGKVTVSPVVVPCDSLSLNATDGREDVRKSKDAATLLGEPAVEPWFFTRRRADSRRSPSPRIRAEASCCDSVARGLAG